MKNKENEKYVKAGLTGAIVIAVGLLLFFFIYRFAVVRAAWRFILRSMRPFIYGGIMAYLLAPFCGRMEKRLGKLSKKKDSRWVNGVAILLSLLLMAGVVWLLFKLILPQVWKSVAAMVNDFPQKSQEIEEWLLRLLKSRPETASAMEGFYDQIIERIQRYLDNELVPTLHSWAERAGSHLFEILSITKDLLIGLLISSYYLANRRRLGGQARLIFHSMVPCEWAERIRLEFRFADRMFNGFFRGKLLDSLIVGVICLIGTYAMGISSAMLISLIIGITNIIPVFGPFIGAVPCAVLLLMESPMKCLYFVIFIFILQQIDGNFIGPKILGGSIGLSGFWVMFAILLFGGLWGIVGMIIGVPLFAVIYDIFRQIVFQRLHARGDEDVVSEYVDTFHPGVTEEEIPMFVKPRETITPEHTHEHAHAAPEK